jgi:hypothetical protein
MQGDLTINNGTNDTDEEEAISVGDVFIAGSLGINGGAGRDVVNVSFAEVLQSLAITVGAGNDEVNVFNTRVVDEAFIRLGLGDDFLSWIADDSIGVDVGGSMTIQGGGGNDDVDILGIDSGAGAIEIAGGLNLLLGSGDDGGAVVTPVTLSFVNAGSASKIYGGTGDDVVEISDSYFADLILRMGAGNDTVTITNTEGSLLAVGGTGSDDALFVIDSPSLVAVVRLFETYEEV